MTIQTPDGPASAAQVAAAGLGEDDRGEAVRALEAQFGELVVEFRRFIQAAAQRVSPGMLPGEFKALSTIDRKGPLTVSALADAMMSDKGLVSRTVRKLEGLGLVARTPDPNDGRSSLISVTPHGTDRLAEARMPEENRLFESLRAWSVDDIRQLTVLLHALSHGEVPPG